MVLRIRGGQLVTRNRKAAAETDLEVKEEKLRSCLDMKDRLLSCLSVWVWFVRCQNSLIYVWCIAHGSGLLVRQQYFSTGHWTVEETVDILHVCCSDFM